MSNIKLVGRELSVMRAIEHQGSTGDYLQERTSIDPHDLCDILNGMMDLGFVEAYPEGHHLPTMDPVALAQLHKTRFEINPSYYQEIKKLLMRR
jgi:hypothetical protein